MKENNLKADLHLHSTASDGSLRPEVLVDAAHKHNLGVIALTDHDTVDGVADAVKRGLEYGMKVLAGIELSAYEDDEVHILGYNVPYENPEFLKRIAELNNLRFVRQTKIIEKLNSFGVNITMDEVERAAAGEVVGRVHIAKTMVKKGYCQSVAEAFEKFIGMGQKAFIEDCRLTPVEAVCLINNCGGVSVLAHPSRMQLDYEKFDALIKKLKAAGLKGIESEYFSQTKAEKERFRRVAERYSLIKTGGSDFHDFCSWCPFGEYFIPDDDTVKLLRI